MARPSVTSPEVQLQEEEEEEEGGEARRQITVARQIAAKFNMFSSPVVQRITARLEMLLDDTRTRTGRQAGGAQGGAAEQEKARRKRVVAERFRSMIWALRNVLSYETEWMLTRARERARYRALFAPRVFERLQKLVDEARARVGEAARAQEGAQDGQPPAKKAKVIEASAAAADGDAGKGVQTGEGGAGAAMQGSGSKMEKEEGSGGSLEGMPCSYGCEGDDSAVIRWCIPCKRYAALAMHMRSGA
jgi:hypothetical protein